MKLWVAFGVVLLLGLGIGAFILQGREKSDSVEATYITSGQANVRSAPTANGSQVLGTLTVGTPLNGEIVDGTDGREWLIVSTGERRGGFVWMGNLLPSTPSRRAPKIGDAFDHTPAPAVTRPRFRIRYTCLIGDEPTKFSMCGGRYSEISVLKDGKQMPLPEDFHERTNVTFDVEDSDFQASARVDAGVARIRLERIDDSQRVVETKFTTGTWDELWRSARIHSPNLANRQPQQASRPQRSVSTYSRLTVFCMLGTTSTEFRDCLSRDDGLQGSLAIRRVGNTFDIGARIPGGTQTTIDLDPGQTAVVEGRIPRDVERVAIQFSHNGRLIRHYVSNREGEGDFETIQETFTAR